jgi:phage recombination protein Bet
MTALMIVAKQYSLNPWAREIYAYPDKGGIVPVVGVDGWARIINNHPQIDGIEFIYSKETTEWKKKCVHEWIECVITRKDRSKPIVVREYFDEVCRMVSYSTPWDSHPKRMHRHKAMIQCARIAFGFGGIYDSDEAEGMAETEKVINPLPEKPKATSAANDFDSLMVLIRTMSVEDFKTVDPSLFSADEKIAIRKAMTARKNEITAEKEANVVAEIMPEATWEQRIQECGDNATLTALIAEMPEAVRLDYDDLIEKTYD